MSLSDSNRISSPPLSPWPTHAPGNSDASETSGHHGAFTGMDQQRPRRPILSEKDLAAVRKRLTYHMSESEEPVEAKTESCSSDGTRRSTEAGASREASGSFGPDPQVPQMSSNDPQVRVLGPAPTTTAVTSASSASVVTRREMPPQTQSLFDGIRRGNRRVFEHVPPQQTAQRSWGIHIDWQDHQTGRTPLTLALSQGEWDIAVELLSLGADPDLLDGKEDMPVELASPMSGLILQFFSWSARKQSGDWRSINEKLLQALLTLRDSAEGHTMLTWAAGRRHDRLACMLIDAGARFDLASKQGEGPFEAACRRGSLSLVLFMLDSWPELVTTDLGRTFFRLALRGAVEARRPAVVGEMLSAFRRIHRAGGKRSLPEDAVDVKEIVPRDWRTEADAYHSFFGGQASTTFGFITALQRTRDDCLLNPAECRLLMLEDMLLLAVRKGASKVVEMIEAHYKRASGIPLASRVYSGAGDASGT